MCVGGDVAEKIDFRECPSLSTVCLCGIAMAEFTYGAED